MPNTTQLASSWAMVCAPCWRISSIASAPSPPMPVSITPMRCAPAARADRAEQRVHRRPVAVDRRVVGDAQAVAGRRAAPASGAGRRARCRRRPARTTSPSSASFTSMRHSESSRRAKVCGEARRHVLRDQDRRHRCRQAASAPRAAPRRRRWRRRCRSRAVAAARRGRRAPAARGAERAPRGARAAGERPAPRTRAPAAARIFSAISWRSRLPAGRSSPAWGRSPPRRAPAPAGSSRRPARVSEETMITGSGRTAIRLRRNSSPSMRGISTSSVITSGGVRGCARSPAAGRAPAPQQLHVGLRADHARQEGAHHGGIVDDQDADHRRAARRSRPRRRAAAGQPRAGSRARAARTVSLGSASQPLDLHLAAVRGRSAPCAGTRPAGPAPATPDALLAQELQHELAVLGADVERVEAGQHAARRRTPWPPGGGGRRPAGSCR